MKITKFGHSCILVEEKNVRILIDPGTYSKGFENLTDLDVILYTHEHGDHVNLDSLTKLVQNNPGVQIRTNRGVGKLLDSKSFKYKLLTHGQSEQFKGVKVEAFGENHAIIHNDLGCVDNTGYFIANKLFHPGDLLFVPPVKIEILAVPLEAPWLKLSEAIDYVLQVKPKVCFAIHDIRLTEFGLSSSFRNANLVLNAKNFNLLKLENEKQYEF